MRFVAVALVCACLPGPEQPPVTPPPTQEAQAWLDAHNAVRRNPQPSPPSPLPELTWSADAAAVAQNYSAQCVYAHNPNRGTRGEKIAASAPPGSWQLTTAVSAWA